ALDPPRILLDPLRNLVHELVLPEAPGARVVGHERIVATAEPTLEPAEVADREADVDDRVLARLVVVAPDVRLPRADPGESRRLHLDQPARSPLARRLHPEAAFDRDEREHEERIVAGPVRLQE